MICLSQSDNLGQTAHIFGRRPGIYWLELYRAYANIWAATKYLLGRGVQVLDCPRRTGIWSSKHFGYRQFHVYMPAVWNLQRLGWHVTHST